MLGKFYHFLFKLNRPSEIILFKTLVPKSKSRLVPIKNLYLILPLIRKYKNTLRKNIKIRLCTYNPIKTVYRLPEVYCSFIKIYIFETYQASHCNSSFKNFANQIGFILLALVDFTQLNTGATLLNPTNPLALSLDEINSFGTSETFPSNEDNFFFQV